MLPCSCEPVSLLSTEVLQDASVVDVVVVTYNSADTISACLEPLMLDPALRLTVVDNASSDHTVDLVREMDVEVVARSVNGGFAVGCNVGWMKGRAPYVLFLNPDAVIEPRAVRTMLERFAWSDSIGIVAPKVVYPNGELAFYLRRFPHPTRTFAQALHLHHLFPRASWTGEVIADRRVYEAPAPHDWAPGACLLIRRSLLEELEGFDESFFMYCEDKDLCKRSWEHGYQVWYEPSAVCVHAGSASAPRASLLPVLAESRMKYSRKHSGSAEAAAQRAALVLEAAARIVFVRGGMAGRVGHVRALGRLLSL